MLCAVNRLFITLSVKRSYCQLPYIQGQRVDKKIREYFYYIDHEGMVKIPETLFLKRYFFSIFSFSLQLFLDDARIKNFTSCFKDKHFIQFFFKRLRFNTSNRYQHEFPYISLCGIERNYIRCDDLPIVFTEVIPNDKG